jgi:hypothetical protein
MANYISFDCKISWKHEFVIRYACNILHTTTLKTLNLVFSHEIVWTKFWWNVYVAKWLSVQMPTHSNEPELKLKCVLRQRNIIIKHILFLFFKSYGAELMMILLTSQTLNNHRITNRKRWIFIKWLETRWSQAKSKKTQQYASFNNCWWSHQLINPSKPETILLVKLKAFTIHPSIHPLRMF